jgi:hypothetical protein
MYVFRKNIGDLDQLKTDTVVPSLIRPLPLKASPLIRPGFKCTKIVKCNELFSSSDVTLLINPFFSLQKG